MSHIMSQKTATGEWVCIVNLCLVAKTWICLKYSASILHDTTASVLQHDSEYTSRLGLYSVYFVNSEMGRVILLCIYLLFSEMFAHNLCCSLLQPFQGSYALNLMSTLSPISPCGRLKAMYFKSFFYFVVLINLDISVPLILNN